MTFEEVDAGPGRRLLVRSDRRAEAVAAGLLRPETWEAQLTGGGAGRGRAGRLQLPDGTSLTLKRMRRGGSLASLWRDRFLGRERLIRNMTVAREAIARGVATPAPVALLTAEGPPGLFRAWLATETVEGARDLAALLRERAAGPAEVAASLRVVRAMHDAGIEHRDLNLGNLLLRSGPTGPEAFVIDLDRARVLPHALLRRARQAALRRLERSHAKLFGAPGPFGADGAEWYEGYAAGDPELARFLAGHRRAR